MTLKEWVNKDFLNFFNVIKRKFADKTEVDALSQEIYKELEKYVQKVEGKGLSANDFTDELKKKLEDLMDREELDAALKAVNDLIENLESGGVEGIIDTLNEIKEFLEGYKEGDTLLEIIKQTVKEVTDSYTELVENTKTEINETIDSTKSDLEQKIKEGDNKLDAKIDETKTTLEGELNTAKEELDSKIDDTKSELESTITSTNQATRDWADEKFVTELGTREDFITWTKNGEVHDLTVPFAEHATNADHATTADSAGNVTWNNVEEHPTTLEGYGITDGFNEINVVGEGNAITTGSGEGHTITLTKGQTFVLKSELGTSVPTLENGQIPNKYLPSFVDDVLEYDTKDSFPETGESGKIYVTKDTNITYRWSGTEYVEISKSLALGETNSTAFSGDRGKALEDALKGFKATINGKTITITINGVSQTITLPDPAWGDVTGKPNTLPNQYSLKAGSKTYNGSTDVTITAADLGVSTTAEADNRYVKKAGDAMTGTLTISPTGVAASLALSKTDGYRYIRFSGGNDNIWDISHGGSNGGDSALEFLKTRGRSRDVIVKFFANGNVGIGTNAADAKLHVAGDIYSSNKITALSQIVVNSPTNGLWTSSDGAISIITDSDKDTSYPLIVARKSAGYTDANRRFSMEFHGSTGGVWWFLGDDQTKFKFEKSGDLTAAGKAIATGFKTPSGTSSQFLKADGSVDSNTYLTTSNASSTYVTKTDAGKYVTTDTAQTVSGVKTFSSTQSFTNTTKPFSVTSTVLVNNLNADLLDGVQLCVIGNNHGVTQSFARGKYTTLNQYFGNGNVVTIDPKPTDDTTINSANVTVFSVGDNENRNTQLAFPYMRDAIYYRRHLDDIWSNWKTVAFNEDLSSKYVTLNTEQTITATKTFQSTQTGSASKEPCLLLNNPSGTHTESGAGAYIKFLVNGQYLGYTGYNMMMAFIANKAAGGARIGVADSGTPEYWTKGTEGDGRKKYTLYHTGNLTISEYQKKVPIVQQGNVSTLTADWDKKYVWSAAQTSNLTINLGTKPTDGFDHYIILILKIGTSKPTISLPNTIKFADNLSFETNEVVEINITLGNSTVGEYLGLWKAYKG